MPAKPRFSFGVADMRWAIYIDIEGFGALYEKENEVLLALCDLMEGIYRLGTYCFSETPNRIYAHQTGDGFVIVSEFGSESLEPPIAIAIALLRHVAWRGRFAKACIAEGKYADIQGCYPRLVMDAKDESGLVRMGNGGSIMTTFNTMGTALIKAYKLSNQAPGSLLILAQSESARIPSNCLSHAVNDLIVIDWVHTDLPKVKEIQGRASLKKPAAPEIERKFSEYFKKDIPMDWKISTKKYLRLE